MTIYDAEQEAEAARTNARNRVCEFAIFVTREMASAGLKLPAEVVPGWERKDFSLEWTHGRPANTPRACRDYMEALLGLLIQARASGAIERYAATVAEYDAIVIPEDV